MSTALRPGLAAMRGRLPEALHDVAMSRVLEVHVRGQLIGQAADLAPAHGVGLAGDRERPRAGLADAAGRQMAVDDRIDLVDAAARLVDALRIERDGPLGFGEPVEEQRHRRPRPGRRCRRSVQPSGAATCCSAASAPVVMPSTNALSMAPRDARCASRPLNSTRRRCPGEAAGADRRRRRSGAARIDDHDAARRVAGLGGHHALEQHRMAPGGVGADEDHEVGEFEILVAAGHGVAAERALVAGDRRGHAQPRIGVDVGGADEALHQLVGDVIVLGQQLAGDIEGDRVRPVLAIDLAEALGDDDRAPRPSSLPAR